MTSTASDLTGGASMRSSKRQAAWALVLTLVATLMSVVVAAAPAKAEESCPLPSTVYSVAPWGDIFFTGWPNERVILPIQTMDVYPWDYVQFGGEGIARNTKVTINVSGGLYGAYDLTLADSNCMVNPWDNGFFVSPYVTSGVYRVTADFSTPLGNWTAWIVFDVYIHSGITPSAGSVRKSGGPLLLPSNQAKPRS
jgi:hypothetical protein